MGFGAKTSDNMLIFNLRWEASSDTANLSKIWNLIKHKAVGYGTKTLINILMFNLIWKVSSGMANVSKDLKSNRIQRNEIWHQNLDNYCNI